MTGIRRTSLFVIVLSLALLLINSCSPGSSRTLEVISGSENETLEPLIEKFGKEHHVQVNLHYKGSVDMMLQMSDTDFPYDAVWPANSLWISLGDRDRRVRHVRSIMTSPVVFGIREDRARELGFVGREVYIRDILEAIRDGRLSFMMTSATQSNSGASAYLGFLNALSGTAGVMTKDTLSDPALRTDIRDLLSGINRSSGSSGWLKDLFLESDYDAMVNYEAIMIETNQELVRQGRQPLHIIYPVDGIVIADSPLGYVNKGDDNKEALFLEFQEYLLSDEVQGSIGSFGRRTGFGGLMGKTDTAVFNPDWGIDTGRVLSPIRMPGSEVIAEALRLYQSEFRKPSYTVFALDYSGSMSGSGEEELKRAMATLLDQEEAAKYMIQTGFEDMIVVLPFSSEILLARNTDWTARGDDAEGLERLLSEIERLNPGGGTDLYVPVIAGLDHLSGVQNLDEYIPAIILLTDGEHTESTSFKQFRAAYDSAGLDVPVFSIVFGNAVEKELKELSDYTRARVFDGRKDLIAAFRNVKGYN
jgi:Ca-activated chloride channel family protein